MQMKLNLDDLPVWFKHLSASARRKLIRQLVSGIDYEQALAMLEGENQNKEQDTKGGNREEESLASVDLSDWQ